MFGEQSFAQLRTGFRPVRKSRLPLFHMLVSVSKKNILYKWYTVTVILKVCCHVCTVKTWEQTLRTIALIQWLAYTILFTTQRNYKVAFVMYVTVSFGGWAECMSEKSMLAEGSGTTPGSDKTARRWDTVIRKTMMLKMITLTQPHNLHQEENRSDNCYHSNLLQFRNY